MASIVPRPENLAPSIIFVRGERVLLDADLAGLYGVEARSLNQAVARNRGRFPDDFMFQLSAEEYEVIRSQFVTASKGAGSNSSLIVTSSRENKPLRSHRGQGEMRVREDDQR